MCSVSIWLLACFEIPCRWECVVVPPFQYNGHSANHICRRTFRFCWNERISAINACACNKGCTTSPVNKITLSIGLSALGIEGTSNPHSIHIDCIRTASEKNQTRLNAGQINSHLEVEWKWIAMECYNSHHYLLAFASYLSNNKNVNQ